MLPAAVWVSAPLAIVMPPPIASTSTVAAPVVISPAAVCEMPANERTLMLPAVLETTAFKVRSPPVPKVLSKMLPVPNAVTT